MVNLLIQCIKRLYGLCVFTVLLPFWRGPAMLKADAECTTHSFYSISHGLLFSLADSAFLSTELMVKNADLLHSLSLSLPSVSVFCCDIGPVG